MKTLIIIFFGWISIHCYPFFTPPDYRDSYIGNYSCLATYTYLNVSNKLSSSSLNYTLTVNKSATDSLLILNTREGELCVKLVGNSFRSPYGKHYFGKFSGDSIYVTNIPSMGPTSYGYVGKK